MSAIYIIFVGDKKQLQSVIIVPTLAYVTLCNKSGGNNWFSVSQNACYNNTAAIVVTLTQWIWLCYYRYIKHAVLGIFMNPNLPYVKQTHVTIFAQRRGKRVIFVPRIFHQIRLRPSFTFYSSNIANAV